MTKNKIKTIVMVVTILLALTLAVGWITQTVVKNKKDNSYTETTGCFIVTPDNSENGIMTLSAELYSESVSDGESINENAAAFYTGEVYTLTADVSSVKGNNEVNWSVSFKNPNSIYASGNDVLNYIELIPVEDDTHTVRLKCLQPFMERIAVKAAIKNNSGCYATCICDYEQRFVYSLTIGDYSFRTDGTQGYSNGKKIELFQAVYDADLSQSVSTDYTIKAETTLYTLESDRHAVPVSDISFVIEPTEECRSNYADFELATFEGSGEVGTIENFFDEIWAHADNDDYSFIEAVKNDHTPLYRIRISGAPCGEVVFGICLNYILPEDFISLNADNVTF